MKATDGYGMKWFWPMLLRHLTQRLKRTV